MSAGVKSLLPYNRFRKLKEPHNIWIVAALPVPYQKFYREWMGSEDKETPVHWIPVDKEWVRNPETGEVKQYQNVPIPVVYPDQMHQGIWGGEGVIEGLIKKAKYRSPVPKFWVPNFQKTVVYSEILDKYLSVVVTERALELIDQHAGLDSYLLKTPAYDLKSLLALKLKRKLFFSLLDKDFLIKDSEKQAKLCEQYKDYVIPREDAEWYGYSVNEAQIKYDLEVKNSNRPKPLKHEIRQKYYQNLITKNTDEHQEQDTPSTSWVKKLNPFSKPAEAP